MVGVGPMCGACGKAEGGGEIPTVSVQPMEAPPQLVPARRQCYTRWWILFRGTDTKYPIHNLV